MKFSPYFYPRNYSKLRVGLAAAMLGASSLLPAQMPEVLDLPTALTYAVDHNFAIRQARERIREQDGLIVEVKGAVYRMFRSTAATVSKTRICPTWSIQTKTGSCRYR